MLFRSKLPLMCVSVQYYNKIMGSELLKVFVNFTITDDVKSAQSLLEDELNGKFTIEMTLNEKVYDLNVPFDEFKGRNNIIKQLEKLLKLEDMNVIYDDFIKQIEDNKAKMVGDFNVIEKPPEISYSIKDEVEKELEKENNKENNTV